MSQASSAASGDEEKQQKKKKVKGINNYVLRAMRP